MMEQHDEEQYVLAKRRRARRDHQAAHKLVNSHLRRAAKIAGSYRGYSPGCWSNPRVVDRRCTLQMESCPKFHNEVGASIVRIGCREFKCIGEKPPQDHPHIYLNMGDTGEVICPYCSTLFRFDPSLGAHDADPADCAYGDLDWACIR
jgi:uncharacterized Zn-finger protein